MRHSSAHLPSFVRARPPRSCYDSAHPRRCPSQQAWWLKRVIYAAIFCAVVHGAQSAMLLHDFTGCWDGHVRYSKLVQLGGSMTVECDVRRAVVGVAPAMDQMCFPCHREHSIFLPSMEHVEQQQSSRKRRERGGESFECVQEKRADCMCFLFCIALMKKYLRTANFW